MVITVIEQEVLKFCLVPQKRKNILEDVLGISNQSKNFNLRLLPLIELGVLDRTIKDKPNSLHQKYFTTNIGKVVLYIVDNH